MLEGLKKRILKLFMSKEELLNREQKRQKIIFQRTFEKRRKEYESEYREKNNMNADEVITDVNVRKDIIARATLAANDKINKRLKRKLVKKITLDPHGILYNVTYASGVMETNRPGLSAAEQDKKEMSELLHAANSVRGDIEYLTFYNQFFGDIEAMAFYRTYFDPNTKLGRKIWKIMDINLSEQTPIEQQKRRLLEKFRTEALDATGFKSLFIPGRRSRFNILRRVQNWFILQEEFLNKDSRLSLHQYQRPLRATIFLHFLKRSGLNFVRIIMLGLFLPLTDTVNYIKKNPILFLIFTVFAISCFLIPPLTMIPASIAAFIGISALSGLAYSAVAILAGIYGTLLWNIIAIKTVNSVSNMLSDIWIILNDKDFWLWQFGRFLFGMKDPTVDVQLRELAKGKTPLQLASEALQSAEAVKSQVAAVSKESDTGNDKLGHTPEKYLTKPVVAILENKYVLEFKETSVIVHAPKLLNKMTKELFFNHKNLNELLYLYNFIRANSHHFAALKNVNVGAILRQCIRSFISAEERISLFQALELPAMGTKNIPILAFLSDNLIPVAVDELADNNNNNNNNIGDSYTTVITGNTAITEETTDDQILFDLMYQSLESDDELDGISLDVLKQIALHLSNENASIREEEDVSDLSDDDDDEDDADDVQEEQAQAQQDQVQQDQVQQDSEVSIQMSINDSPQSDSISSQPATSAHVINSELGRRASVASGSHRSRFDEAKAQAAKQSVDGISTNSRINRTITLTKGDVTRLAALFKK